MNDEGEPILTVQPITPQIKLLRQKYAESVVSQADLMDGLAKQLLTLEMGIPALYATVLKLIQGKDATLPLNNWIIFAFIFWFLALLLTLASLVPRNWRVDPTLIKPDPTGKTTALTLEQFFYETAKYKRRLLIAACLLFWAGIICAAFVLFQGATP